ncbi:MAG: cytochrome b561 [Phenylobacterium sp.]|jgi:cytochrome b561
MRQTLKNTTDTYGWISISLHWICALLIFGLFGLGLYMVELTYYDTWYHDSFHWHESLGLIFAALLLLRIVWRLRNPKPTAIAANATQQAIARWAHRMLYLLMILIPVSGYLISTADGHDIALFNWLTLPSVTGKVSNMETISGQIHYWLSVAIIALTVGHIAAALKHHFIDKDNTLKRILKP